jgi:hypothetical protein
MDEADATHRSPSRLISFRAVISVLDGHPWYSGYLPTDCSSTLRWWCVFLLNFRYIFMNYTYIHTFFLLEVWSYHT